MYKCKYKKINAKFFSKNNSKLLTELKNMLSNKYELQRFSDNSIPYNFEIRIFLKERNNCVFHGNAMPVVGIFSENDVVLIDKEGNLIDIVSENIFKTLYKEIKE